MFYIQRTIIVRESRKNEKQIWYLQISLYFSFIRKNFSVLFFLQNRNGRKEAAKHWVYPAESVRFGGLIVYYRQFLKSGEGDNAHIYVCMYVCIYVCMYVCMYVCIYAYVCVCVHACVHVYIYIHTYIHTYIYTYIHIYIHTYIHTYTHTHTHTHTHMRKYI